MLFIAIQVNAFRGQRLSLLGNFPASSSASIPFEAVFIEATRSLFVKQTLVAGVATFRLFCCGEGRRFLQILALFIPAGEAVLRFRISFINSSILNENSLSFAENMSRF
ncbi:hypothetical protein CR205_19455 [Alteribacter lacisalsi]|uniref:Uncharacterized protein n=1 Tax=Alteribacter lacisalsi TaxID=2045244 RepID=A0A2W0HFV9_9BACI|nr:hypothetical protein CR205_19455 [Alteribacter lacisalsi]